MVKGEKKKLRQFSSGLITSFWTPILSCLRWFEEFRRNLNEGRVCWNKKEKGRKHEINALNHLISSELFNFFSLIINQKASKNKYNERVSISPLSVSKHERIDSTWNIMKIHVHKPVVSWERKKKKNGKKYHQKGRKLIINIMMMKTRIVKSKSLRDENSFTTALQNYYDFLSFLTTRAQPCLFLSWLNTHRDILKSIKFAFCQLLTSNEILASLPLVDSTQSMMLLPKKNRKIV